MRGTVRGDVVPEDRALQLLQRAADFSRPSSSRNSSLVCRYAASASTSRPVRYNASISCPRSRSCNGLEAISDSISPISSPSVPGLDPVPPAPPAALLAAGRSPPARTAHTRTRQAAQPATAPAPSTAAVRAGRIAAGQRPPPLSAKRLETNRVNLLGRDRQPVAPPLRHDHTSAQRLTQMRDVDPPPRSWRRPPGPAHPTAHRSGDRSRPPRRGEVPGQPATPAAARHPAPEARRPAPPPAAQVSGIPPLAPYRPAWRNCSRPARPRRPAATLLATGRSRHPSVRAGRSPRPRRHSSPHRW